jgi:predicted nucleotidyltransferase component of viral defense system
MNEPIESAMKSKAYVEVARLQDDVIQIISESIKAVLHGGTAIWRCYDGKRFSEDIDLYVKKEADVKKLVNRIALSDLHIVFGRERHGTIYYDISNNETDLSLQIRIMKTSGVLVLYERITGVKTEIHSLEPEDLIIEKMAAYSDRKLIRDVYDIFILTKVVSNKSKVTNKLNLFLSAIEKPKDPNVLKNLIYTGLVPSFDEMVEYLKRWCKT